MHGKPVESRRCPRNGKRACDCWSHFGPRARGKAQPRTPRSPETGLLASHNRGLRGRWPRKDRPMPTVRLAGLFGLAAFAAQAQVNPPIVAHPFEPVVVTAARTVTEPPPTLREAVVVTRDELDAAGPITFAEALQRYAGVEIRSTGGPGQPTGIFLRGAGSAQTLVLIDGLRVGSASSGTTAIEAIPLEMIERIEVVKGPMSSVYGSDAIGGVVQGFTRGGSVPHLYRAMGYGSDNDRRLSAGLTTVEGDTTLALS